MERAETIARIARLRSAAASEEEEHRILAELRNAFSGVEILDLLFWGDLSDEQVADQLFAKRPIQL